MYGFPAFAPGGLTSGVRLISGTCIVRLCQNISHRLHFLVIAAERWLNYSDFMDILRIERSDEVDRGKAELCSGIVCKRRQLPEILCPRPPSIWRGVPPFSGTICDRSFPENPLGHHPIILHLEESNERSAPSIWATNAGEKITAGDVALGSSGQS